eukprot:7275301-Pyramimonas_sp.AAC.1
MRVAISYHTHARAIPKGGFRLPRTQKKRLHGDQGHHVAQRRCPPNALGRRENKASSGVGLL